MVDLQRYRATSGETNFIERIKAPIFLEVILAIDIMQVPQLNLEEKVNPSILKDYFSSIDYRSWLQYQGKIYSTDI